MVKRADYLSNTMTLSVPEEAKVRLNLEPVDRSFDAVKARELVVKKEMDNIKKARKEILDIVAKHAKEGCKEVTFGMPFDPEGTRNKGWLFEDHQEYMESLGFKYNYTKILWWNSLYSVSWGEE